MYNRSKNKGKYINKEDFSKLIMLSQKMKALLRERKYEEVENEYEKFKKENPNIEIDKNEYIISQLMVSYNRQKKEEMYNKSIEKAEYSRNDKGKIESGTVASQLMVTYNGLAELYIKKEKKKKAIEELKKVEEEAERWRDENGKIASKTVASQCMVACKKKAEIYNELEKTSQLGRLYKRVKNGKRKEESEFEGVINIGTTEQENSVLYSIRAKMLEGEVEAKDLEKLRNEKEEIGEYKYQVMLIAIQMKKGRKQEAELIVKEMLKNKDLSEKQIKEMKRVREEIKKKKAIYNIGLYDEILEIDVEKGQVYIERLKEEQIKAEECKEEHQTIQQIEERKKKTERNQKRHKRILTEFKIGREKNDNDSEKKISQKNEEEKEEKKELNIVIDEEVREILKKEIEKKYINIQSIDSQEKQKEKIKRINRIEEMLEAKDGKTILKLVSYLISEGYKEKMQEKYLEETKFIETLIKITRLKEIKEDEIESIKKDIIEKYKDDKNVEDTVDKLIKNAKKTRKEQVKENIAFKESLKIKLNLKKPIKIEEKNNIIAKRKEELQEF